MIVSITLIWVTVFLFERCSQQGFKITCLLPLLLLLVSWIPDLYLTRIVSRYLKDKRRKY
ncbi:MAG: hypothetical protein R6U44_07420 [Archaeoglobaceae archaeon]